MKGKHFYLGILLISVQSVAPAACRCAEGASTASGTRTGATPGVAPGASSAPRNRKASRVEKPGSTRDSGRDAARRKEPGRDASQPGGRVQAGPSPGEREADEGKRPDPVPHKPMRPRQSAADDRERCRATYRRPARAADGTPIVYREPVTVGGPPWRTFMVAGRMCVALPAQAGMGPTDWEFAGLLRVICHRKMSKSLYGFLEQPLASHPKAAGRMELRLVSDRNGKALDAWVQQNDGIPEPMARCWIDELKRAHYFKPTYLPTFSALIPVVLLPAR